MYILQKLRFCKKKVTNRLFMSNAKQKSSILITFKLFEDGLKIQNINKKEHTDTLDVLNESQYI